MAAKAGMCCEHAERLDEFTVECDENIVELVAKEAEESIAWAGRYYKISCPHVGDAKIGRSWYDIH